MKVLVTGGTGLVGSHSVKAILDAAQTSGSSYAPRLSRAGARAARCARRGASGGRRHRRRVRAQGERALPDEQAATKLIYLAIQNAHPAWKTPQPLDHSDIAALKIHFGDRLPDQPSPRPQRQKVGQSRARQSARHSGLDRDRLAHPWTTRVRVLRGCLGRAAAVSSPLEQLDVDLPHATAHLEHRRALDPALLKERHHALGGLVQTALAVPLRDAAREAAVEEPIAAPRVTAVRRQLVTHELVTRQRARARRAAPGDLPPSMPGSLRPRR